MMGRDQPACPRGSYVVTGTDTNVGKTVLSAGLVAALDGFYWKPIQAGLEGETDSDVVRRLSGLPRERVLEEAYRLELPASPHIAADREGVTIDVDAIRRPITTAPLVIEGVGGLMVPLTSEVLFIDVLSRWLCPVILAARTSLGTINHSLLSLEALRRRDIPILGVAFIGNEEPDVERTIVTRGGVRSLGRLAWLSPLDRVSLLAAVRSSFDLGAFA